MLKKIAPWLILLIYVLVVSSFVSTKHQAVVCDGINVLIADSLSKKFVDEGDILNMLTRADISVLGEPLKSINTHEVEQEVQNNSLVRKCRVYTSIDGKLNIELWQREPLIRVIDRRGSGYYIDDEGSIITLSSKFSPHLLVVNGNIETPFVPEASVNIFDPEFGNRTETLKNIYELASFIHGNELWNSQIVQLYVSNKKEFEIVPRVGPHIIELGSIDNYEEKFENLKILYEKGLNNIGWNQYIKINLKYKDQIVCTKS